MKALEVRSLALMLIMLLNQATTVFAQECAPVPSGLVGWWRGEDNGKDVTGAHNGTTPFGMAYVAGEVGQAFSYHYDHYDMSRVTVPDSPDFKLTNSMTIEAWIYPRAACNYVLFRGDDRPGLDPYSVDCRTANAVGFTIDDLNGNSARVEAPIRYNQWQHIAATLDDCAGDMKLYVNGVLAGQINTAVRPGAELDPNYNPGLGIGNVEGTAQTWPFNGMIDEVALYSRALNLSEIQGIFEAGSAGKCVPVTKLSSRQTLTGDMSAEAELTKKAASRPAKVPPGLIAWWRGEGNGNDATGAHDGTTPFGMIYVRGEVGQAFSYHYDHYDMSRITVPDSPAFKLTNSLTIEAWICPKAACNYVLFRGDDRPGLDPYSVDCRTPKAVGFTIDDLNGNSARVEAPIKYNQWQHIAATLNGATGEMRLYVNGALGGHIKTAVRPGADLDPDYTPGLGIGNVEGTAQTWPFNGMIDEVALYSRALTSKEIQGIFKAGSAGKRVKSSY